MSFSKPIERQNFWHNSCKKIRCSYYSDTQTSGYSIYRTYDGQDIGNAVWTSSDQECRLAAKAANQMQQNVVCSKYHNANHNQFAYSVYRISDGKDLGNATIASFSDCQKAVLSARNGIFCSTYVMNNQTWWSMYSIHSGVDIGQKVYATIESCQLNY